jgi:transcriptional regulator with XRE-family HTH domain
MTPIIAKFCALRKQPIAILPPQSSAMAEKTLNQILAENLRAVLAARALSDKELGKKANVSPRTIANYKADEQEFTAKGKERSAKLAEIERIAAALDLHPLQLLTDRSEQERRAQEIAQILAGQVPAKPGAQEKRLRHAA